MNIPTKKLHAIRYCYQDGKNINRLNIENKVNILQQLGLPILTIIFASQLYSKSMFLFFAIIFILLFISILQTLFLLKNRRSIDLNKVESYLLRLASVEQVISIELYHVNPKNKVICAKLMVNNCDTLNMDLLKKKIQIDLSRYFGVTESVITLKNSLENTADNQMKTTNQMKFNIFHPLSFKYKRYLNLKKTGISRL